MSKVRQAMLDHYEALFLLDLLGDEASMAPRTRKLYAKLEALAKRFTEDVMRSIEGEQR